MYQIERKITAMVKQRNMRYIMSDWLIINKLIIEHIIDIAVKPSINRKLILIY